ncbi:hypothetical protein BS50DRAFT_573024 [Corynespora cassiicola Philippines]|uniref:Uncharacterized protein n=1 Tax=Corynespora cassiicola Philippines TaxID=1448308 RepID=A0A2T2NRI9_CORCC|nr:hypothetical protein BS50DRAFT_573024 [Corynespora cassiicola Philippines]
MNSQETNQSFSMFVNYGACDSQNSVQDQPAAPTSAPMKKEPGAGKKSRAELLRLRLGFGLYKVKTNQVSRRGSDIISTWELSSSSEALDNNTLAAAIPSSTDSNITIQQNQVPSITLSPARKSPKPAFVKANLDPFRPIGKLEHVPVLLPTAVSSRTIQDYHIPSSPPQTDNEPLASPLGLDEDNLRTPTAKRTRRDSESDHKDAAESPANNDNNSSNNNNNDDDDDDDHSNAEDRDESVQERLQRLREKRLNNEGELTSSAVKGHAAKGLLELMSGRR